METGLIIKNLRKTKGMTQDEFANKLNKLTGNSYKRNTISNYELGVSDPSIKDLPAIAKIFDVSIDELFGVKGGPSHFLAEEPIAEYNHPNEL